MDLKKKSFQEEWLWNDNYLCTKVYFRYYIIQLQRNQGRKNATLYPGLPSVIFISVKQWPAHRFPSPNWVLWECCWLILCLIGILLAILTYAPPAQISTSKRKKKAQMASLGLCWKWHSVTSGNGKLAVLPWWRVNEEGSIIAAA